MDRYTGASEIMVLEQIIIATIAVSLISLVGMALLATKTRKIEEKLLYVVTFATGTLLGASFFDLLPEAIELIEPQLALQVALVGLLTFFVIEKFIRWHHHHHYDKQHHEHDKEYHKPVAYLSLIGDAFHNFFDGVAIAAAFLINPAVGITTTIAIVLHEIPQEVSDFGLLLHSGMKPKKALTLNLISGLIAVIGGVAFFFFSSIVENIEAYALAFTAGMFIYIATADLLPELHKEHRIDKSIVQLLLVLLGAGLIWIITTTLHV